MKSFVYKVKKLDLFCSYSNPVCRKLTKIIMVNDSKNGGKLLFKYDHYFESMWEAREWGGFRSVLT